MIYITGDTHGEFCPRLNKKSFNGAAGDHLIICGDFGGVWRDSQEERYWLDWLGSRPYKILFVDGNHENFDMLAKFPEAEWNGGKVRFIRDKLIHLMRGQVYTIEGSTFFTMGGASSHDIKDGILEPDDPDIERKIKQLRQRRALYRVNHISWWKEELPSEEEYAEADKNLEAYNRSVDYIITHCAPTSIDDAIGRGNYKNDALTDYLEEIYQTCDFKRWFFGHYHDNIKISDRMALLYENIVCCDTGPQI